MKIKMSEGYEKKIRHTRDKYVCVPGVNDALDELVNTRIYNKDVKYLRTLPEEELKHLHTLASMCIDSSPDVARATSYGTYGKIKNLYHRLEYILYNHSAPYWIEMEDE